MIMSYSQLKDIQPVYYPHDFLLIQQNIKTNDKKLKDVENCQLCASISYDEKNGEEKQLHDNDK